MSNYIQVLKRLEKDRRARDPIAEEEVRGEPGKQQPSSEITAAASAAPATAPSAAPAALPPPTAVSAARPGSGALRPPPAIVAPPPVQNATPDRARRIVEAPTAPQIAADVPRGIATLFDNVRALPSERATRAVVFSGASSLESVARVTDGLALHAGRHGMSVLRAHLNSQGGHAVLVPANGAPEAPVGEALQIDLDGGTTPAQLDAWFEHVAPASDLAIITGPPLTDSIDAALLARVCDGLVIVADTEVTPRGALQTAAERARVAGCRTLGVVMNGPKNQMPAWMRRLTREDH